MYYKLSGPDLRKQTISTMLFLIIKNPQKEILYLAFPKQTAFRLSNLPADRRSHSFLHASLMADKHFKYHTHQRLVSLNNSQTRELHPYQA